MTHINFPTQSLYFPKASLLQTEMEINWQESLWKGFIFISFSDSFHMQNKCGAFISFRIDTTNATNRFENVWNGFSSILNSSCLQ